MGFILGLVLDHIGILAGSRLGKKRLNGFAITLMPQNDCFGKYSRAFSSPLNRKSLQQVDTVVIVLAPVL